MGWTWYVASHYKNGKVDRKAECDAYFMESLNAGHYRVEKSSMVGSVYYAAVTNLKKYDAENKTYIDIIEEEQETFGVVFLTSTNMKDFYNFGYKDMTEDMMPYYFDCPKSILNLLSETDNKNALEWREMCWNKINNRENKPSLGKLPIGTVIEFEYGGKTVRYEKTKPMYQFKTPFWFNGETYIPKKRIPENYTIVS